MYKNEIDTVSDETVKMLTGRFPPTYVPKLYRIERNHISDEKRGSSLHSMTETTKKESDGRRVVHGQISPEKRKCVLRAEEATWLYWFYHRIIKGVMRNMSVRDDDKKTLDEIQDGRLCGCEQIQTDYRIRKCFTAFQYIIVDRVSFTFDKSYRLRMNVNRPMKDVRPESNMVEMN